MAEIASIFLSPVVDTLVKTTASLIGEEWVAIHGVEKELETLSSSLISIKAAIKDAEQMKMDADCDESTRVWLAELKDAAYDAEDILDFFETENFLWSRKNQVRRFRPSISGSTPSHKSRVAHKIKEISTKLDQIAKNKNNYLDVIQRMRTNFFLSEISHRGNPRSDDYITPSETIADVFGRESDRDKLIDLMLSNESDVEHDVSVIPIIGMGGLGKTTLAQYIFNDEKVKNHFEFRMWVNVSVDFNPERIFKDMLEYHTEMQFSIGLPIVTLRSRLLEFLGRKNFLLVLDNVWDVNYDQWEPLKDLLKQGGRGSRVLITTRNNGVSEIMGTQPPHELGCLGEEECWSLFKNIAFKDYNSLGCGRQKEFEKIGREITAKCSGLPLAVRAMGGILRGNLEISKWKGISRDSIWKLEEWNQGRLKILPALKLSYYHLSPHLKQCFAYCSVFPKAYVFDRKELVKHWMAEAFIQPIGQKSVEEIGLDNFNELLGRSFFQNFNIDDKERYRMHDLHHDLAASVLSPVCIHVNNKSCTDLSGKTRHVSLFCQDLESPTSHIIEKCNKLRTLLLPTEHLKSFGQTPKKMFHSLNYIRVLDLSSSTIPELPSSIEELKLLRYLDLSRTEIKVLPNSICNLCNLQTLKLLGCLWLFELPKDLSNLVNLHYLELDEMFWFKCKMLPPSIGKLTRLRTLPTFLVGTVKGGHGIEELKEMEHLTGTLHISKLENAVNAAEAKLNEKESLQKLVLEWSDKDFNQEDESRAEKALKDLQPHSNLGELAIHRFKGSSFPSWMTDGSLLENLVTLTLSHCIKCNTLSVGHLPCLRELYMKGMQELEEWPGAFCLSLRRLGISNCPKLRKVPNLMPNLRVMKIKKCDSLKAFPLAPSLMFLILIDNLVLEDWQENSFILQDIQGNQVSLPPFINLLELKMENCPNIEALPRMFAPQKLEIKGCRLTALPNPELAQRLQHLALETCSDETLVKAIPSTNSLYSLVISNISNLSSFPKLSHLPGLKSLYVSDCSDLTSLEEEEGSLKSLSSLKLLSIQRCPKLESLPDEGLPTALECLMIGSCPILKSLGSNHSLKNLLSLSDLYLEDCPLIQSFPEDGLPCSLQHLEIHGCPLLIKQCQKEGAGGKEWPKIKDVPDQEIDPIKLPSTPVLPKEKKRSCFISCSKGF